MTRTLFGGLLILGSVGCVTLQPIGPLAKNFGGDPAGQVVTVDPVTKVAPAKDLPRGPVIQPAPPPTPPRTDVVPSEVTEANTADIIRRLQAELEADRRSAEAMPRPSELSVIK